MELPRLPSFLTLVLLLSASVTLAQAQTAHHDHLGQVQFSTSCQQATREDFNRAVALLHSFWFDASAKAFESVAQQDPACAMAYWGVAMTWLGNPFGWPPNPKALQEGWAAVEKAKAIGGNTPREQAYIAAAEAFYRDASTVDHRTRALAYERAYGTTPPHPSRRPGSGGVLRPGPERHGAARG